MARRNSTPGFRFRPTDVELIEFFLKRKVRGKKIPSGVIAELDLYKYAPWDLPDKSVLQSGDLEWYFFCPQGKKYLSGGRLNRSTEAGYWKTTGKDRAVEHKNRVVGMIKTLVFHTGKAPKGNRTDWVMHEFRLQDKEMVDEGISQDSYVICRIFQKEGPGPRNGAQYGKPYDEKDWDTDEEIDSVQSDRVASVSTPVPIQPSGSDISNAKDIHPSTSGCAGLTSELCVSKLMPSCSAHNAIPNNQVVSVSCVSESMPSCSALSSPNCALDSVSHLSAVPFAPNYDVDSLSCVSKLMSSCLPLALAPSNLVDASSSVPELIPSCTTRPSSSSPNHQDDDNILYLLDYFKEDDDTKAVNENNGIEKVDPDQANNAECAPCLDQNVIFENLGDLDSLVGLGEGTSGQKTGLSTSDMFYVGDDMFRSWESQDFLELMDLAGPQPWQR
ncbi:NAC domain-containing protein 82 [Vigna radiata var. radiata]|uniref:NAC domain-containing protein 82 n=1 Tax=Vigna radiata var. radiata TaxID=3916 RepID=A0A1S3W201_VIGRR|nr:NAC domain-containing protein 82 [Vigna radiata var. radiata]